MFSFVILDCSFVIIGDCVLFGFFVFIFLVIYEIGVQLWRDVVEYVCLVIIKDDCWIGGNVIIMFGVMIGKGCIIGVGSVVIKDIFDFLVVIGLFVKVVKIVDLVLDI